MLNRRHLMLSGAGAGLALRGQAYAQAFPSQPIRLICPWPPGGSTDGVMRLMADSAGKILGVPVLIDNKAGAAGTMGAIDLSNRAKPDGYTLSQLPITVFRIPHMQKVSFDTLNDFTWIICMTGYTFGFVVRSDSPIKSIADLVAYARAKPGTFTYGTTGKGSSPHIAVEQFSRRAGIQLTPVPFKGGAENMQAVLGGHVLGNSDSTGWAGHVDSGALRLLATYGTQRTKRWPNVPTLTELGYDTVSESPFGVCGPRGMDPAVVTVLHDTFRKTLGDPAVLAALDRYDQTVKYMNTADYTRWARETFVESREIMETLGLAMKT